MRAVLLASVLAGFVPTQARADSSREIHVETPGERPLANKLWLAGLGGTSVVFGALGLYFNLEARSAANDVSASKPTGTVWGPEQDALVEKADRASSRMTIAYTIAGGFAIATIVTFILTAPESEHQVIRARKVEVAPVPGGAMAFTGWTF